MKTINQYEIPIVRHGDEISSTLQLPIDFECVGVSANGDKVIMWGLIDDTSDVADVCFRMYLSGDEIPALHVDNDLYLGTVVLSDGTTLHVFEGRGE